MKKRMTKRRVVRTSLRRRRQEFAKKATRARIFSAFAERMFHLPHWQAAVNRIRAAYPSWSRTKVARLAAKWFNEYALRLAENRFQDDQDAKDPTKRLTVKKARATRRPEEFNDTRLIDAKMIMRHTFDAGKYQKPREDMFLLF